MTEIEEKLLERIVVDPKIMVGKPVMRGLKRENSPVVDGFRVHYNFIRPHQALNGLTPAEKANIDLDLGTNKWLSLIKKSVNHNVIGK